MELNELLRRLADGERFTEWRWLNGQRVRLPLSDALPPIREGDVSVVRRWIERNLTGLAAAVNSLAQREDRPSLIRRNRADGDCTGLQFSQHADGAVSLLVTLKEASSQKLGIQLARYGLLLLAVADAAGRTPRDLVCTIGELILLDGDEVEDVALAPVSVRLPQRGPLGLTQLDWSRVVVGELVSA